MGVDEARQHINRAKRQLEKVQAASWEPDPESAVTWAFYAYENCVIALAEMHERSWAKNHVDKVRLARAFYAEELISRDIGDELEELNRLRKDVAYDEPGADLDERDLEMIASELEEYIDEIESLMGALK